MDKCLIIIMLLVCMTSCTNKDDAKSSMIKDLILENTQLREENARYRQLYGELPQYPNNESHGIWNVDKYVDDFGDSTKHGYVHAEVYGTFSNSATTDSKLRVKFLIDDNSMRIQLYEYGGNHPIKGEGFLNFKAKSSDGKLVAFKTYNNDSGNNIYDDTFNDTNGYISLDELIDFIDENKMIKFVAETSKYSISEYKFTIPDGSRLKDALNKANEQNESI